MHDVVGWRCAVCGTVVEMPHPAPWRCPRSTLTDRHHVLHAVRRTDAPSEPIDDDVHPFVRHDRRLAWSANAAAFGMSDDARHRLVHELDDAVAAVAGTGFAPTPFRVADDLTVALAPSSARLWVKDETGGVGGSQKARHLFTILLHLRAMEELGLFDERPPLAIASCGNAALAAATLAKAAEWPIDVYVPMWMSDGFGDRLDELGARTHRCERRDDDPPGDPAMFRFREAVDAGAVPFTVQGPENALCIDGGRTIGWELAEQAASATGPGRLDSVFAQVGGGAFAACLGDGLLDHPEPPRLIAVQAEGCAPLARAWHLGGHADSDWDEVMTPWREPASLADGILDDETYDWIAVLDAVRRSRGDVVVAAEERIVEAHRLVVGAGLPVSPTGTAGLAGVLEAVARGGDDAPRGDVAVVLTGVAR